tara:strand:+ start:10731 stop:12524 length:1794 start_codon:yes stop_codon:yes gene_type:complete
MLTGQEILKEYYQCLKDPTYAIQNYLETFDKTQEGFVPFTLFPKQFDIIKDYEKHRYNLVTKPRQAGISTVTQAYMATKIAFADKKNPETILVIANKLKLAQKFLKGIKYYLNQYPRWVWGAEYYGTEENEKKDIFLASNQTELIMVNGCQVIAVATSVDALRGYTPTYLVFDEAAFIEKGSELYAAAITSLGTGGKCTLISTPNGHDPLYYKTYKTALAGLNKYNIIEMKWYQDLRYNKDLSWIHDETEEEIVEVEFTFESYERMYKGGYSPTSTWYRDTCESMNHNPRTIAQELDVSFLGSGGNVIDDKYINYHEKHNSMEPVWKNGIEEDIWVWKAPEEGHQYLLGADVARGDGADSSTIVILDFNTMEQVMEYKGKLQPDLLAYIIDEYARIYDALVVVDITGGMGVGTITKLMELKTPNLFYGQVSSKALDKLEKKTQTYTNYGKIPGFNVSPGVRTPLISHFEKMVRTNSVKIRSVRLIDEMRTFIYVNGRADHQDGAHDDLIMALAYCLYIAETEFKKLKESKAKAKAMLAGWVMANSNEDGTRAYQGTDFVSKDDRRKKPKKKPNFSHVVSKNMQDPTGQYMWLFSGTK